MKRVALATRMTSVLLCLFLLLGISSTAVFADGNSDAPAEEKNGLVLVGETLKNAIGDEQSQVTAAYDEESATATATGLGGVEQFRFRMPEAVNGADYPYLVIKYKYDQVYDNAKLSLYRTNFEAVNKDGQTALAANRSQDGQIATFGDGEWHIQVLDMRTIQFESQKNFPAIGGKTWSNYTYQSFTWMPFGWGGVKDSVFSIAYFGFFKTEEAAKAYTKQVDGVVLAGGALKAGMDGTSTGTVTAVFEDNCVKATGVETKADAEQIRFRMPEAVDGGKYPFMAIKYKYDKSYDNAKLSLFRTNFEAVNKDGATAKASNRSADGQIATFSDGEWQTAILDMRTVTFENNKNFPAIGGKTWANYTYHTFTFLPFGWNAVKDSVFCLEYFGFFKTEEDAKKYAGMDEVVDDSTGFVYGAKRIGVTWQINTAASINMTAKVNEDETVATVVANTASGQKAARLYIPFNEPFDQATNKFFVIKYKYAQGDLFADLQLMRCIKDEGEANPLSRVFDDSIETTADGEWHTAIVDLSTLEFDNDKYVGKTWTTHELTGVYLMPWGGSPATAGAQVEVELFAFCATENDARLLVGLEPITPDNPSNPENPDNPNKPDDGKDTGTSVPTGEDTGKQPTTDSKPSATEAPAGEVKGCASSLSVGTIGLILTVAGTAYVAFRRKKEI